MRLLFVAAFLGTAALTTAAPATAACVPIRDFGGVCVTVGGDGTLYQKCVGLPGEPCTPVEVPAPGACVRAGGKNWNVIPICLQ